MALTSSGADTFAGLIKHRPWQAWIPASILARLPRAMLPLAWVVVAQARTGSVTLGATLAGVGSLSACFIAPLRGRLLDRQDLRRAVQIDSLVSAVIFFLLIVVIAADLPIWTLFALCAAQGWANAGMMSGLRALLVVVVPFEQLRRAHFVESLVTELCWAIGPLLAGALVLLGSVTVTLTVMVALECVAVLALTRVGVLRQEVIPRSELSRRRDMRRLTALTVVLVTGFGVLEANVPQRMSQYGLSVGAAGWFLGVLSAGSCAGGLFVSFRPLRRRRSYIRPALLFVGFGVLNLPVAFANNTAVYGLSLLLSTLAFVPLTGFVAAEYEARLTEGQRGEGFSLMIFGTMLGGSAGYLLNGLLIGWLPARALPLISIGLFVCAAIVLIGYDLRRRR
jgi:MFS family permease